jgi:hypothetical protein
LKALFSDSWANRCSFKLIDAAKVKKYTEFSDESKDITHIYSYNKVMSPQDRKGICKILNRTNYRIMAWYFGPKDAEKCGLKNFKLLHQMPM